MKQIEREIEEGVLIMIDEYERFAPCSEGSNSWITKRTYVSKDRVRVVFVYESNDCGVKLDPVVINDAEIVEHLINTIDEED